jgi:hypothetical protein
MAVIGTLAATNDTFALGGANSEAKLHKINVSTAAATSIVTVYHGTSTSGTVVDTIDAASKGTTHYEGARFPNGLFVKMTVAAAKVSVIAA